MTDSDHKKFIQDVKNFLANEPEESKVYIGVDSESFLTKKKIRMANYYSVVVIHKNGRNGCKIFGHKSTERDYSSDKRKPTPRLMTEVYKASALYLELVDAIGIRDVEIHLDLNPSAKHVSNLIVDQAIGYIKGSCNVVPFIKPDAWCASSVADKLLRIQSK
jgi:predicted RNase H-related nuclease YkuK (DUF458 family)